MHDTEVAGRMHAGEEDGRLSEEDEIARLRGVLAELPTTEEEDAALLQGRCSLCACSPDVCIVCLHRSQVHGTNNTAVMPGGVCASCSPSTGSACVLTGPGACRGWRERARPQGEGHRCVPHHEEAGSEANYSPAREEVA